VIWGAFKSGVKHLLFLGSSCIFPKEALQPMKEEYLLTGPLEPTNEPYAVAKIAGIKLCENLNRQYGNRYRAVMPTNLFGPNDNYNLENSHVLPAMIRKFHLAKLAGAGDGDAIKQDEECFGPIPEDIKASLNAIAFKSGHRGVFSGIANEEGSPAVLLWGDGSPFREFLHVDDMADACIHVMNMDDSSYEAATSNHLVSFLNVGAGKDLTIRDLSELVKDIVGYTGEVVFDATRPNGTMKKLLDVSRLKSGGWQAKIPLEVGIKMTYDAYLAQTP
jgi:GDP-L-fucose synthase